MSVEGNIIAGFPATSSNPRAWFSPELSDTGYFGYSIVNSPIFNGEMRKYVGLTTQDIIISKSDQSVINVEDNIIFKLEVNQNQPAGNYSNAIVFTITSNIS